jgi:hypothetical protein
VCSSDLSGLPDLKVLEGELKRSSQAVRKIFKALFR